MHPVDAILRQARELLGTGLTTQAAAAGFGGDVGGAQLRGWEGQTGEGVVAEHAAIEASRERLRAAYREAAEVIAGVNQHGEQARRDLAAVEEGWQHDKESLDDNAEVPEGPASFLQAAQRRIDEAASIVEQTASLYQQAAQQIRAAAGDLPGAGGA